MIRFAPSSFKKIKWRHIGVGALGGLGALTAIAAGGLIYLDSPSGQARLRARLNAMLANEESQIEIGRIEGSLYGRFRLSDIVFRDKNGVWARAERVAVAWRPLALLRGNANIDDLHADSFQVLRQPEAGTETDASETRLQLPKFPVDLDIAHFGIDEIKLAKPVFGAAAELKAGGALQFGDGRSYGARLDVIRTDQGADELHLDIAYDRISGALNADGRALAPKGSLFLDLLGLPADRALRVEFKGHGPIDDWAGILRADLGDMRVADANMRHEAGSYSIEAMLNAGDLISDQNATLLGREAEFIATLSPGKTRSFSDLNVILKAETLTLMARSVIDEGNPGAADRLDLSLDLHKAAPFNALIAPLTLTPFKAKGRITDLRDNPKLTLEIQDLRLASPGQFSFDIGSELEARQTGGAIAFASRGSVRNISGAAFKNLKTVKESPLDWQVKGQYDRRAGQIDIKTLRLQNAAAEVNGEARYDLKNGPLSAVFHIKTAALTTFAKTMAGTLEAQVTLNRATAGSPIEADIKIAGRNLDLGDATANQIVGPAPNLSAQAIYGPEGNLALEEFSLKGKSLMLAAAARMTPDQVIEAGAYRLSLSDLQELEALRPLQLGGQLDITGALSGPLSSPALSAEMGLKHLDIQGVAFENVTLKAKARNIAEAPQAQIELNGASSLGALDGQAQLSSIESGTTDVRQLSLALGPFTAQGHLSLPPGAPAEGEITLSTQKGKALPGAARGAIDAQLRLSAQNGQQQIALKGDMKKLSIPLGGGDLLLLDSARIDGAMLLADAQPRLDIDAQLKGLSHPRLQMAMADIDIRQEGPLTRLDMRANGGETMPYDLAITGETGKTEDGRGRRYRIDLNGTVDQKPLRTEAPVEIIIETGGKLRIAPFTALMGDGRIKGRLSSAPEQFAAHLDVERADLRTLTVFLPDLPVTGVMTGDIDVKADLKHSDGRFSFDMSGLRMRDDSIAIDENLHVKLEGDTDGRILNVKGGSSAPGMYDARLTAAIPIRLSEVGRKFELRENDPVSAALRWSGEVAPIWPVFNMVNHDLSGEIEANLDLSGSLAQPQLNGGLKLREARYENMQTGFVAQSIQAEATVSNNHLTLDRLTATDGNSGTIEAHGELSVASDMSFDARADLDLKDVHLLRQPDLSAVASADLRFEKAERETSLSGGITVNQANVGAIGGGASEVVELDVTEINGETVEAETGEKRGQHIGPIKLDVQADAPRRIFIRSYGMDSEWKARLKIGGTSDEPVLNGAASLVRGTFDFAGKRFKLTGGNINFPNEKSNDPILDVTAEHQMNDLTAIIHITGRASAPKIEVTSNPSLPQDEIMARILFGTSATQLSALEAVQLAAAINSLSGGGGPGIVDNVRGALGIDRLSIDSNQGRDAATTVTGGKYLTDNVYLEVSTAPATGQTATSIEVGLTRNLSLVTRRTIDGDNNLSIRWSWNY